MFLFILIAIILVVLYGLFIFAGLIGWQGLSSLNKKQGHFVPKNQSFTIIIAARNEEINILNLLEDILKQDYPADKIAVLIVDDHSMDSTSDIVEKFNSKQSNIQLLKLNEGQQGKKFALLHAVNFAKGDILAFTDADCRLKSTWISSAAKYFSDPDCNLLTGPVDYHGNTFFEQFQRLELSALNGMGAAFVALGKPILCNGANLFYRNDFFNEIKDNIRKELASGDDIFLLQAAGKINSDGIRFSKDLESIVTTSANKSLRDFFHQRIRWASKSKYYKDNLPNVIAAVLLAYSFITLGFLIAAIFDPKLIFFTASLFVAKTLLDLVFFIRITELYKINRLIWMVPLYEVFYILYVLVIGFISLFSVKYIWKGRTIEN